MAAAILEKENEWEECSSEGEDKLEKIPRHEIAFLTRVRRERMNWGSERKVIGSKNRR